MIKFHVYGKVVGTKYLGVVEAETAEKALELANELETTHVSVCHQCSRQIEDPTLDDIFVETAE